MNLRKSSFAAAALAVASFGMLTTACQKKSADAQTADSVAVESTAAEEQPAQSADLSDADIAKKLDVFGADSTASDLKTTPSGLKYRIVKEGKENGKKPAATDEVEVNYEGRFLDGTIFDSSYQRGESINFPLNRVIPGWTEGVQLMKEGDIYEFYIPSDLAYGKQGAPGAIPPDTPLLFKVELIKVVK